MENLTEQILKNTNRGRDLIEEVFPQFVGIAENKQVSVREGDRVPSAHLRTYNDIVWLKDFGAPGKAVDGISVYAQANGMDRSEAVKALAKRYGLLNNPHRPDSSVTYAANTDNVPKGKRTLTFKDHFTSKELNLLAPGLTEAQAMELGWHSVAEMTISIGESSYDHTIGSQLMTVKSTAANPIFARDMHDADTGELITRKIYQPYYVPQPGKSNYKFSYADKGKGPGNYVHGLYELRQALKSGREVKAVIFGSGERDALVIKTNGYEPLWMNSETTTIPFDVVHELRDLGLRLYYIPDIDLTGKDMAAQNIRNHPTVLTAWLPEAMMKHTGDQRKPKKDLRDWVAEHPHHHDFERLLMQARPYQFWTIHCDGEAEGNGAKGKKLKVSVSHDYMMYFLKMNGFYKYKDPACKEYKIVRIEGHIITEYAPSEVRDFIKRWIDENVPHYIRESVLNSKAARLDSFNDLDVVEPDFCYTDEGWQIFTFRNAQVKVSAEGITVLEKKDYRHVWSHKVIQHDFQLQDMMFGWEFYTDDQGKTTAAVNNLQFVSKVMQVLEYTSEIYWQKTERGEELTGEEAMEECLSFTSKLFAIGYLMHQHRTRPYDWAVVALDYNTPTDSEGAFGGTAKSFIVETVMKKSGMKVDPVDPDDIMDNKFAFELIDRTTDIAVIGEPPDNFPYRKLNSSITDSMTVNPKNKRHYVIPYEDLPKFYIPTNFALHDYSDSIMRRLMPIVYSDYFHHASMEKGFKDERTIRSVMNMEIMGDKYPETEWNNDFNFILQCQVFYFNALAVIGGKITPKLDRIIKRHYSSSLEDKFVDWADGYIGTERLNVEFSRDLAMRDYRVSKNDQDITSNSFKRKMSAWASMNGYTLNPVDKCNDKQDRRIRRQDNGVTNEYYYIDSHPDATV